MDYNATPALFVGVESGYVKGPGVDKKFVLVETISTAEVCEVTKDDPNRNVVVVSVENLCDKAENKRSMMQLALKFSDCRIMVRDILIHLAKGGDDTAKYLLSQLNTHLNRPNDSVDE